MHTLNLVQIFLELMSYYESQQFWVFLLLCKFLLKPKCRSLLLGDIVQFHFINWPKLYRLIINFHNFDQNKKIALAFSSEMLTFIINYFPDGRLNPRHQKSFSPLKFSFPELKWLAFLLEMI